MAFQRPLTTGLSLGLALISSLLLSNGCTKSHDLTGPGLADGSIEIGDGDDDEPAGSGARGGRGGTGGRAGAAASGGRGGSGARAGAGGRAGTGGRGGAAAAAGSGMGMGTCTGCPALNLFAGLLGATSCCTTENACGLSATALGVVDCFPLNAPGAADTTCPAVDIAGLVTLNGCCGPDGMCGALDTYVGLGCAAVAVGDPVSCTPQ